MVLGPIYRQNNVSPQFLHFQGERLAAGERALGVMLNEVDFTYGMSTHIPNSHMAQDTQLVIAQGRAYRGRTVRIGSRTFNDAQIVYLKKQSGASGRDRFFVKGYEGEQVRIFSVRFQDQTPSTASNIQTDLIAGEAGWPEGDPHWRNVALPIVKSPSDGSAARGDQFIHDQHDSYTGSPIGTRSNFLHDTGAAFQPGQH